MAEHFKKDRVLISACLAGVRCRYDNMIIQAADLDRLADTFELVPICPEMEGGLGTPRPKAWIECGNGREVWEGRARVVNEKGEDVTEIFKTGAVAALKVAQTNRLKKAFLKQKSPSCGAGIIYNDRGTKTVRGNGVTAELLMMNGIEVEPL